MPSVQQTAALLAEHGLSVGYGGRIFGLLPDLQQRIAGHFLGISLLDALEHVEVLLTTRPQAPQGVLLSAEYNQTLQAFLSSRTAIDAGLEAHAKSLDTPLQELSTANHFMGDNIIAVLQLGDMVYMDDEIHWLTTFLAAQKTPLGFVPVYFKMYLDILRLQLGKHAEPVAAWLENQIEVTKDL